MKRLVSKHSINGKFLKINLHMSIIAQLIYKVIKYNHSVLFKRHLSEVHICNYINILYCISIYLQISKEASIIF